MLANYTITRILVILFIMGVGYALAKALYYESFMGIMLAIISLGAAIYFLWVLADARKQMQAEKEEIV